MPPEPSPSVRVLIVDDEPLARRAIREVRRKGDGALCILSNGVEIPVSRRYRKALLGEFGDGVRYRDGEA